MATIDLEELGHQLRSRRKALRMRSGELARRIGVSQTYIWLIEQAKPRTSGEPSRPSERVLVAWTEALRMDAEERREIMELAGYFEPGSSALRLMSPGPEAQRSALQMVRSDERPMSPSARAYDQPQMAAPTPMFSEAGSGADQRGRTPATSWDDEQQLVTQVQGVLQTARASGRQDEAMGLLQSFLSWLQTHVRGT